MLHQWYPPAKYLFMPMYRFYRRLLGGKRHAFAALMATSGVLHMLVFSMLGLAFNRDPLYSIAFTGCVYTTLTIVAFFMVPEKVTID